MANWIADAVRNKGGLHRRLGIPMNKRVPVKMRNKAAHARGALGRSARLAQTLAKLRKH